MGIESLIVLLLVGAVAGWLAGLIVAGRGAGILINMVIGVLGAVVAGFIFPAVGLNFGGGLIAAIIHATLGAVILLVVIKLIRRGA